MAHRGERSTIVMGGAPLKGDTKLNDKQRDKIAKTRDQADIMGESVDKAVGYGVGQKVQAQSVLNRGKEPVQEDAAKSLYTDESTAHDGHGDLVPQSYLEDDAAPGGVWLFWSPADERRICSGLWCGWCGVKQRQAWGSPAGHMAAYLRNVPLSGDVTNPEHLAHEGGYCLPERHGADGCGNKLREGIHYAKDYV